VVMRAGDGSPAKRNHQLYSFCLFYSDSAQGLCLTFQKSQQKKHSSTHPDTGKVQLHFQQKPLSSFMSQSGHARDIIYDRLEPDHNN
jgi:hypothetical protein